ncbi:MAG: hypothetical protein HOI70_11660 [Opitutae bacterium]|jgi:hypothetical protein|nr:hypothetical protein [Opitutae bacterium]
MDKLIDPAKAIQALEMYFPDPWWVPAHLEEKYGGEEAAKKWRENKLREDFSKWLEWAKEQEGFVDALTRMRSIEGKRSKDDFEELKSHILVISFFASPGWYKPADFEDNKVKEHKECIENITSQVKGIKEFRKSLKSNKNNHFQPDSIHLRFLDWLEVLKKEGLVPAENKELDHLSLEFLDRLLESYQLDLELEGYDLGGDNSGFGFGAFMERKSHGVLIYPQKISRQAVREHAEINSYIFYLAMLFRQFTDTTSSGPWLTKFNGEMPDCGGARYENVADLANTLFTSIGWLEDETKELTNKKVMERIKALTDKGVKLGSWLTINY